MNLDYNFKKVSDGQSLAYKKWDNVTNPKGVVIIVHGMAEHIERYDDFANFLNSNGYIVYGADQRGHGRTLGKKGLFAPKNGHKLVVEDQRELFMTVQDENPSLPVNYFAHSMGSYVARALLQRYNLPIKKIILSGTGFESRLKSFEANFLASFICLLGKGNDYGKFLDSQVNGPLSASVENPTSTFDWLTRDHNEVAKYINDSACGFICTNKFYSDFFKIISETCSKGNIKRISSETKILLYSGDKDPVSGENGSGVKKLYNIYTKIGLNAELEFNKGGRHESINETNKQEVYKRFLDFYEA